MDKKNARILYNNGNCIEIEFDNDDNGDNWEKSMYRKDFSRMNVRIIEQMNSYLDQGQPYPYENINYVG